jgi:membrane associated rhomboid family serine protease
MGFGFGPPVTPPVVKQLLIANAIIFLAQLVTGGGDIGASILTRVGAVVPVDVWQRGLLWQPFTYMFLHGSLLHVGMNMFVLWMFAPELALVWGPQRFLRYYLVCGVGAGVLIATVPWLLVYLGLSSPISLVLPTIGASGAIYGVILAFSLTWPDRTIMLMFPPVAFRAIWMIPVFFFMDYAFGPGNVSHLGHLSGVVVGWLYLQRDGRGKRLLPSMEQIRWRWRRFRMRRRLRAVQREENAWRSSGNDRWWH